MIKAKAHSLRRAGYIVVSGLRLLFKKGPRRFVLELNDFIYPRVRKQLRVNISGRSFFVDARNHMYWKRVDRGEAEPYGLKILNDKLADGNIFVDVGSWIGLYTLLGAKIVGGKGSVYAIEPDPIAREALLRNIALNQLTNVKVYQVALSDKLGEICIGPRGSFGNAMTTIRLEHCSGEFMVVKTTTLEAFVRENNITPDFIKMDIEGGEYEVLRGSEDYICSAHPPLLIEVHNHLLSGKQQRYIVQVLQSYDSILYLYDRNQELRPHYQIPAEAILTIKGPVNLFVC